jgi:hypothetical protein
LSYSLTVYSHLNHCHIYKKGNNSKDGPDKTVELTNTIVSDVSSSNSKKDAVPYTRLKRFGLNLGSKSTAISRIDVKSDSQSRFDFNED